MKKVLISLLCVVIVMSAFAACSNGGNKEKESNTQTTQEITTDEAKIKESDAINLIKSYSNKELGLSEADAKEVSFMVKKSGVEYNGKYYINVIATIKTAHEDTTDADGKKITTYTFDNKGEYLISYDGKTVLAKSGDEKDYKKLKAKAVPTTKAQETVSHEHESESTTKKK